MDEGDSRTLDRILDQILCFAQERKRLFVDASKNPMITGLQQILKMARNGEQHTFRAMRFDMDDLGENYWCNSATTLKLVFVKSDFQKGILFDAKTQETMWIYYVDTLPIAKKSIFDSQLPYIMSEPFESCTDEPSKLDYPALNHVKIMLQHDCVGDHNQGYGCIIANADIQPKMPSPRYCVIETCALYTQCPRSFYCENHSSHASANPLAHVVHLLERCGELLN
jgi:hypothetical protein